MTNSVLSDLSFLNTQQSVALYGAGATGQFVLRKIEAERPDLKVLCFIDDIKKGTINNIPLRPLSEIPSNTIVLITTSYWREVRTKLEKVSLKYYVVDLLSGKSKKEIVERVFGEKSIKFFSPNNYLAQVSENFEKIERCTVDWIDNFDSNSIFYDIGASSGIYSLYAAVTQGCETIAVEPDAQNFAVLEMNHHLNRGNMNGRFISLNLGLGSQAALMPLKCQEYLAGAHGKVFDLKNRTQQNDMQFDHIQFLLVDSLDFLMDRYSLPVPQYLKIDVDGAELDVIEGCKVALSSTSFKELMIETDLDTFDRMNRQLEKIGLELKERFSIEEIIGGEIQNVHNYLYHKAVV